VEVFFSYLASSPVSCSTLRNTAASNDSAGWLTAHIQFMDNDQHTLFFAFYT
jgi:hypothetical protein